MSKIYQKEPSFTHNEHGIPLKSYFNHGIIPWHWHEEFEFLYIRHGNAICHLEKETFPVHEGSLVIICDSSAHTVLPADGTNLMSLTYDAVVFHPSLFQADSEPLLRYFKPPYSLKRCLTMDNKIEKMVIELERQLYKIASEKPFGYEFQIHSLVPRIFHEIFSHKLYASNDLLCCNKTTRMSFTEVIRYISLHYAERIELSDLAQISNYSPAYFSHLFKNFTGKTPFEFINYYRVYKASVLLRNTDKSILEVAASNGFDNLGHFIKIFKRYMGTTPHQYRLSLANDPLA